MYTLVNNNRVIGKYNLFFDAWAIAYLELSLFSKIIGPTDTVTINPHNKN